MRLVSLNIFFLFLYLPSVLGQLTEEVIKSNFVVNMIKFVEWEDADSIGRYTIGVMAKDEVFEQFRNVARSVRIRNKSLDVVQFRRLNDIGGVDILYVGGRNNKFARRIWDIALREKILMITDSCVFRESTMINLLDLNKPGRQFEINRENLDKANFVVSPKLLYYGGTQEDLRKLYQTSERELANVQLELEHRAALLKEQGEELESRKQEVLALNDEIDTREQLLKLMTSEVEAKEDLLDQKISLLETQDAKIRDREADIALQSAQLLRQKHEIEAGKVILNRQKLAVEDQGKKIEAQQNKIQKQTRTLDRQTGRIQQQNDRIEKQRTILYFFVAFFTLLVVMIYFIIRAYRIKRQANRELEKKNAAIRKQKEEIQSQQELLKISNQRIERQNQNIKSSIQYALTIQEALLPSKEELNSFFESFVIYRPRDIVSGDFYWVNETRREGGSNNLVFAAVGDCTGHGVPGAFLSMIGVKLLNSIVNERKEHDPKVVLEMLNIAIRKALKQEEKASDDGMDIGLCCLEKAHDNKFRLIYSGARRPLYYCKDQKMRVLAGDRKTVGGRFYKQQDFTNQELLLDRGDRLYLTSDGIADQNAPNRRKFGSKKLISLLGDGLHLSMSEQKVMVEKALDAFQQSEKQRDDIALLAINL